MWEFEHLGIRTSNDHEYGDRGYIPKGISFLWRPTQAPYGIHFQTAKKSFAARIIGERTSYGEMALYLLLIILTGPILF